MNLEDMKDIFLKYEKIRKSGKYNMITDASIIINKMNIDLKTYTTILENYSELNRMYNK